MNGISQLGCTHSDFYSLETFVKTGRFWIIFSGISIRLMPLVVLQPKLTILDECCHKLSFGASWWSSLDTFYLCWSPLVPVSRNNMNGPMDIWHASREMSSGLGWERGQCLRLVSPISLFSKQNSVRMLFSLWEWLIGTYHGKWNHKCCGMTTNRHHFIQINLAEDTFQRRSHTEANMELQPTELSSEPSSS